MPTIICSWCQYVGQGVDPDSQLDDVIKHEETCEANQDNNPD